MAVSKVILNGTTLIDTTDKTVTSESMLSGITALKNDGTTATGEIVSRTSSDIIVNGNEVRIPKGNYSGTVIKTVPNGTAGTPTASKGTVSNHSVSVTPSVTNTTGYITGGTKTGTAVTVTASELESGTKTITENGTGIDVTGYAAVDVDVPSSGGVTVNPLSVTQNGTYTAPTGTAYSPVTVNVSGGGGNSDFRAVIEGTATNPTLPSELTVIRDYAFEYYSTLALTSLPSGVTSIGQNAFRGCSSLALTSLPNGLTSIGQYAFSNCLRMEIDSLPLSITGSIPSYAFNRCLKITISSVPSGVTSIGQYAFSECNSIISMAFPNTVTSIAANAFYNCANLEQVNGTGIITSIANSAFTRCPSLKTAAFPNASMATLNTIFGHTTAAYADNLLEFADIGSTKAIAANAFANCYALETLVLRRSDAICTLANVSAFLNTPMRGYNSLTGTVYVPSALISSYQTATNWSTLYNDGTVTFTAIEGSDYELD